MSLGTKVVQYLHNTGGERGQMSLLHGTLRISGTLPCATGLGADGRPFCALLAYAKLGQGKDSSGLCRTHEGPLREETGPGLQDSRHLTGTPS